MKEIFLQISNSQDLSQDQVQAVFDRILKNEVSGAKSLPLWANNWWKQQMKSQVVRALKSHATVLPETFTDAM